jgi:hypothetical protein
MFNNCFNLQSHDRKGVVTRIQYRVSSIDNPFSFLCFLLKVGCSTFYVVRLSSVLIPLHLSRILYKSALFMQNKPNFKNAQMNTSICNRKDYGNFRLLFHRKNKAKQSQFKPNFRSKLALFFPILASFFPKLASFFTRFSTKGRVYNCRYSVLTN